jgi:hypothetical protein
MSKDQNPLETLNEIRTMMERSSKFISLSGLSGISAGIVALIGAAVFYLYGDYYSVSGYAPYLYREYSVCSSFPYFLVADAIIVLVLAISLASFFSYRKAKKQNIKFWDSTARRAAINLMVPLAAGGLFCSILLFKGYGLLVAPATLLVYGLALINASNFTFRDIRYLGYAEIVTGLIATVFTGYGLLFWALGFGVFHIVYGIRMYYKYER